MTTAPRPPEPGFNPAAIDRKWQDRWEADRLHQVPDDSPAPNGTK